MSGPEGSWVHGYRARKRALEKIRQPAQPRQDFLIDQGIPPAFSGDVPIVICSSAREALHNSRRSA